MSLTRVSLSRFLMISLLAITTSATIHAECDDSSNCGSFGTFYTTFGVGFSTGFQKVPFDRAERFVPTNPLFPNPVFTLDGTIKSLGISQLIGAFSLGYTTPHWHCLKLSVEGFIAANPKFQNEVNTADDRDSASQIFKLWTNRDVYMTPTVGIALKPAYQIYPDVSFGVRLGYGYTRATLRRWGLHTGNIDFNGTSSVLNNYDETKHKNLRTLQAGVSFGIKTSDHITLNMGYFWDHFSSISQTIRTDDPSTGQFFIRDIKLKPTSENFLASVSYSFTPEPYTVCDETSCGHEIYAGIAGNRDTSETFLLIHTANPLAPQFQPAVPFYDTTHNRNPRTSKGWGYEGFIGYGYTLTCGAYLGLEGFYNSTLSKSNDITVFTVPAGFGSAVGGRTRTITGTIKLKDSFGFSFVPGFKLNNHTLLYFKLGFIERRANYITTGVATPPLQLRDQFLTNRNISRNAYGYLLGLGLDLRLCDNLYLRNEFTIAQFATVHFPRYVTPLLSTARFLSSFDRSLKTTSSEYKIGVIYKFPLNGF